MRVWICLCGPFLAGEDYGTVWEEKPDDTNWCQGWDCGWAEVKWEDRE